MNEESDVAGFRPLSGEELRRLAAFQRQLGVRLWCGFLLLLSALVALAFAALYCLGEWRYWGYVPFVFYGCFTVTYYCFYLSLLPSMWAIGRGHQYWVPITLLTVFAFCVPIMGVILWVAALVWCFVPVNPQFKLSEQLLAAYLKFTLATFVMWVVMMAGLFFVGWLISGTPVGWWK